MRIAADVEPAEQQVATVSSRLTATPVAVPIAVGALLVGTGYLLLRRLRDPAGPADARARVEA